MIELHAIRKAFNQGRENEFWALDGIDLSIEARKVTALRGPSGSGKTTLLTLVGCLARPTEGRVRLDGEDISGLPERFLTEIRRRRFGFVFQQFNLIKGLSALDNIILPAYPSGQPRKELLERAEELLARLKLGHRRAARVEWLSGGEQQGDDGGLEQHESRRWRYGVSARRRCGRRAFRPRDRPHRTR